jgi:ribosome-associated protein
MAIRKLTKTAAKKTKFASAKKSSPPKGVSRTKTKHAAPKKVVKKKPLTEQEREFREANVLANLDNKKKGNTKRPKKSSTTKQTTDLFSAVVEGMKEKKAKNITVLDLKEIENRVTDYFVICDADSNTHVGSIADSVEEIVEKLTKERAYHSEGHQNGEWILIDYINIVAHVFLRDTREHYNLESLWGDAKITNIKN